MPRGYIGRFQRRNGGMHGVALGKPNGAPVRLREKTQAQVAATLRMTPAQCSWCERRALYLGGKNPNTGQFYGGCREHRDLCVGTLKAVKL